MSNGYAKSADLATIGWAERSRLRLTIPPTGARAEAGNNEVAGGIDGDAGRAVVGSRTELAAPEEVAGLVVFAAPDAWLWARVDWPVTR